MVRKHGKNGKWTPVYTEKTIMPLLSEDLQDTKTIAQKANCTNMKILQVLNPLADAGKIERQKFGNVLTWKKKPEPKKE